MVAAVTTTRQGKAAESQAVAATPPVSPADAEGALALSRCGAPSRRWRRVGIRWGSIKQMQDAKATRCAHVRWRCGLCAREEVEEMRP
jgi:hypothetical protein